MNSNIELFNVKHSLFASSKAGAMAMGLVSRCCSFSERTNHLGFRVMDNLNIVKDEGLSELFRSNGLN